MSSWNCWKSSATDDGGGITVSDRGRRCWLAGRPIHQPSIPVYLRFPPEVQVSWRKMMETICLYGGWYSRPTKIADSKPPRSPRMGVCVGTHRCAYQQDGGCKCFWWILSASSDAPGKVPLWRWGERMGEILELIFEKPKQDLSQNPPLPHHFEVVEHWKKQKASLLVLDECLETEVLGTENGSVSNNGWIRCCGHRKVQRKL